MTKTDKTSRKSAHTRPAGFTAERAKHWGVSVRVMQQWLKREVPVEDDAAMVQWFTQLTRSSQSRLSKDFQKRITEVRLKLDQRGTTKGDPDWLAFEAQYADTLHTGADDAVLTDLKKQAQFFLFKQRVCTERNDYASADHALKQLSQLSSIIHDMELRAQKLGRDLGDLVPRAEAEAPLRQIAYHLLRCADATLASIITVLTRRDPSGPPLIAEEIAQLVEPILLNHAIIQPIRRAAHGDNPAAPPKWAVDALEAGLNDTIEQSPNPTP